MSKWRKFVYFLALANGMQLPAEIVKELLNIDWILVSQSMAAFFIIKSNFFYLFIEVFILK